MIKNRRAIWLLVLLPLLLAAAVHPVSAQSPNHAALIVAFGDGRVVVRVVSFTGESISGVDLLQQSGLDVAVMVNPGGGAALCAVEGVGCAPTPQECFCQCRGSPCRYWSYFHLRDGAWAYAGMGAADHFLRDGDVDGWVWGDGRTPPPLLSWDEIGAQAGAAPPTALPPPATPPPPATAPPPSVAVPTAAPATAAPTLPTVTPPPPTQPPAPPSAAPTTGPATSAARPATVTPSPLLPETGPPPTLSTAAGAGVPWGAPAAFGGLALLLAALALWLRRRR